LPKEGKGKQPQVVHPSRAGKRLASKVVADPGGIHACCHSSFMEAARPAQECHPPSSFVEAAHITCLPLMVVGSRDPTLGRFVVIVELPAQIRTAGRGCWGRDSGQCPLQIRVKGITSTNFELTAKSQQTSLACASILSAINMSLVSAQSPRAASDVASQDISPKTATGLGFFWVTSVAADGLGLLLGHARLPS
jgi:hypothetical protein